MTNGTWDGQPMVTSYMDLRRFIGILGVALPVVLFLGGVLLFGTGLQASLSAYYHTGMRDVFVGTMCAIGVFLLTYRGNDRKDDIAGNLACVFAVGLAFFPVADGATSTITGKLHFAFAAAFFLTLTYFSLFLFTLTRPGLRPTPRKLTRNRVYRTCGYLMLACVALIAAFKLMRADSLLIDYKVVFILETIAIVAFGVSWLVKGEAILGDLEETAAPEVQYARATTGTGTYFSSTPTSPRPGRARHDRSDSF